MKTLYLVRHAKSSWSNTAMADFDRGLNKRGKKDAPFMGKRLAQYNVLPDLILASPAKRARKTAQIIAEVIGYPKKQIVFDETIYSSSVYDYLAVLQRVSDKNDSIFMVGHNHAITEFGELLASCIIQNIPTSGILAIQFPLNRWNEIEFGQGKCLFFDYPKKHEVKG